MKQRDENNRLTRRDFTVKSALAILGSVPITLGALSACDSDSPTAPSQPPAPPPAPPTSTPPPAPAADVTGVVGTDHGHTAVITGAELTAGNALSLDITGTSNHPHVVELSADEIGQIAGGGRVQKDSSTDSGHAHTVTFN